MQVSRLTTPILARLLQEQRLCQIITLAGGLHLTLLKANLPSWPCPLRHGLGVPCPSCGLSRAVAALLTGQWHQAIALHAFAPVAAVVLLLIGYGSLAPLPLRRPLIHHIARAEQHTAFSAIAIGLFLGYWLVRLIFFRKTFYQLISGQLISGQLISGS